MNATRAAVKPLNPRSPDTKYTGLEPTWRVQPTDDRTSATQCCFLLVQLLLRQKRCT
jgi:hypothetical protein